MTLIARQFSRVAGTILFAAVLAIGCVEHQSDAPGITSVSVTSSVEACHGSGNTVVVNSSNCDGCAQAATLEDWSKCINATAYSLGDGGTLRFMRDSVYEVRSTLYTGGCSTWNDDLNICAGSFPQHDNMTWDAIGSGSRPRILFTVLPPAVGTPPIYRNAIKINGHAVSLINLDIRGPSYDSKTSRVVNTEGINATTMAVNAGLTAPLQPADLLIDSVQINGFREYGIHWHGTNLTIRNSQIRYNSGTGVFLTNGTLSPGVHITGTDISNNGGDGIDMTSSFALIEHDTIRGNGWLSGMFNDPDWSGEKFGIILNPAGRAHNGVVMDSVIVRHNVISDNVLSGIKLMSDSADSFNRIRIENNHISNHSDGHVLDVSGGWAVYFDKRYNADQYAVGPLIISNSYLRYNCLSGNNNTFNPPATGVTVVDSCPPPPPPYSASIEGPDPADWHAECTYHAQLVGATPPFQFQWTATGPGLIDYTPSGGTLFVQTGSTGYVEMWLQVDAANGSVLVTKTVQVGGSGSCN